MSIPDYTFAAHDYRALCRRDLLSPAEILVPLGEGPSLGARKANKRLGAVAEEGS